MTSARYSPMASSSADALSVGFLQAQIVVHNEARRQSLRDVLGAAGFEVEMYGSASSAIPFIRKNPPALLILSDDLTDSPSALGLLKWLDNQDYGEAVHTLVICDTTKPECTQRMLDHGASDLLGNDFTDSELHQRLIIAEFRSTYCRDRLTESRQLRAEATRYREIVRNWPQAAILTPNLSRPIREANDKALQILGLQKDDVIGKYLSLILPDLFEREGFVPYEDFSKEPQRIPDVFYEGPLGETALEVRIVGVDWGNDGATLVTFENLGRLQALERQRSRISQMESVRRFASEMANEFNNILTVVNGNVSLLLASDEAFSDNAIELLETSHRSCKRAGELVKRLTKQDDVALPEVRLHDTYHVVRSSCESACLSPRAEVKVSQNGPLWQVQADENQIANILEALLKNADEALANSVIHVEIDNELLDEDSPLALEAGSYIVVTIHDQGPGIAPDLYERIFEPFFTTKEGAEGLGLTKALGMAQKHHGTIQLEESPTGRGASISLRLPASRECKDLNTPPQVDGGIDSATDLAKVAQPEASCSSRQPKVLFMDDEPEIREVVEKILTSHDFQITCTSCGEEAVEAYYKSIDEGGPFDILLLDLEVNGGMGGKDTVAILRQDFPNIKAVVTTGYLDDAVLSNHREHGFSGVLTKPFQIDDLVSVLRILGGPPA